MTEAPADTNAGTTVCPSTPAPPVIRMIFPSILGPVLASFPMAIARSSRRPELIGPVRDSGPVQPRAARVVGVRDPSIDLVPLAPALISGVPSLRPSRVPLFQTIDVPPRQAAGYE